MSTLSSRPAAPIVVKRRGRDDEVFDPHKLQQSILATCLSLQTPIGHAEDIAARVTRGVQQWCRHHPTMTSDDIRRQATHWLVPLHSEAAYLYNQHKTIV